MAKEKYEGMYLAPTPEVGELVHWIPNADRNEKPRAALVTRVDGPGVVCLDIFPANQCYPMALSGVRHITDPVHVERGIATKENGSWDFLKIPQDRYAFAKSEIDRKQAAREKGEQERRRQLAEMEQRNRLEPATV